MHCFAGVSRSATIVIAYLMQELGMSLVDAMQHVRKQRYFINPNDGFRRQLQAFQRELTLKRAQEGTTQGQSEEESKVVTSIGQDNYSLFNNGTSASNVLKPNFIGQSMNQPA